MSGFQLQRLGQIMEPERGNPYEVEGVLNPAAAHGPDGQLYLFPRLVSERNYSRKDGRELCYSAGVMVLSQEHPQGILYRSPEPVLTPQSPGELRGTIANVVFPTGIDRRDDLGRPDRFDIYYGMADSRIGAARLDVPGHLPRSASADASDGISATQPEVALAE